MFDAHAHAGIITDKALVCTSSTDEILYGYKHWAVGAIPEGGSFNLETLIKHIEKGAQVGEIGLDKRFDDMERQLSIFRSALTVAKEYDRLAIIHSVRTHGLVCDTLKNLGIKRFMIHGYTGSFEMAERFIKQGGIISLSPRAERTKDFSRLLTLPFATETDMKTGTEEEMALYLWNEKLSHLTSCNIERRSEEIMMEALCVKSL